MQYELHDKLVILSEPEAVYALREAWKKIYIEYPSNNTLAILYAQTCLETGRFKRGMHCYNFGNIKAAENYDGYIVYFRCSEVINGKELWFDPKHPQTRFRGYLNAVDGALDYLKFLQKPRYAIALQSLKAGLAEDYVKNVRAAGYFTASLESYLKSILKLVAEFYRRSKELLGWKPPEALLPKPELPETLPAPPEEEIKTIPPNEVDTIPDTPEPIPDKIPGPPKLPTFDSKSNLNLAAIIVFITAIATFIWSIFSK